MKLSGSNVFTQGSKFPVALVIENLAPTIDITSAQAGLKVKFYCLDEHDAVYPQAKTLELSLSGDSSKFVEADDYNTFALVVDSSQLDCGRLAGEVSWKMIDDCSNLPLEPVIPFITDYIIKPKCQSAASLT